MERMLKSDEKPTLTSSDPNVMINLGTKEEPMQMKIGALLKGEEKNQLNLIEEKRMVAMAHGQFSSRNTERPKVLTRFPSSTPATSNCPPYCHRHLPHAFPEQESAARTEPKQTVIAAIRGPSLQQATSRPTPQQPQPSFHPTINSTPEPPQPPQPLYSATPAVVQPPAATSGQPRATPDPSATPLPRASFPQQVTPPEVLCSSLQQSHAPSPLLCEEPPPSTPGSSQIPVPLAASPSVGKFSAQPPTPSPPINSGGTPPCSSRNTERPEVLTGFPSSTPATSNCPPLLPSPSSTCIPGAGECRRDGTKTDRHRCNPRTIPAAGYLTANTTIAPAQLPSDHQLHARTSTAIAAPLLCNSRSRPASSSNLRTATSHTRPLCNSSAPCVIPSASYTTGSPLFQPPAKPRAISSPLRRTTTINAWQLPNSSAPRCQPLCWYV
ncbi:extensin-like [Malania oleifera]|uniref:extensin-like n=1 Tax=Malania oleifera TaxID=397392 RepID=UPI0025AEAE78|nr:extensin-like [Malania oleifera]